MDTVAEARQPRNPSFDVVAEPFLRQEGLPFAQRLSARDIEEAFAQEGALFAQEDLYSTQIVLWAFLAQVLRGGKGAACASAVADIATYLRQVGLPAPSGDTGDYCRARAKLSLPALRRLVAQGAQKLDSQAQGPWLWRGRRAKLVDGFTFTMLDTPENQAAFPQSRAQSPGVGLPIARACAVLSLSTAAIHDLAVGPYAGKQTGENALFRQILGCLEPGDVAVFDRYFCSYMMLALLGPRGVDVCTRLHQARRSDFRKGKRLGPNDHLVTWRRPARPEWMTEEVYAQIPPTMTLRELKFSLGLPGRRTDTITVITTLIDPAAYPKEEIAALFGLRWNVELDLRHIKQTLGLDHVPCKTPSMVQRHLWVTLLAYNLIRGLIATAAATHGKQPRHLGFTLACQTVLSSWMLLSSGAGRDAQGLWTDALARIADNEVANRPGRVEPRVLKRRRHRYPLMKRPREQLRAELQSNPRDTRI